MKDIGIKIIVIMLAAFIILAALFGVVASVYCIIVNDDVYYRILGAFCLCVDTVCITIGIYGAIKDKKFDKIESEHIRARFAMLDEQIELRERYGEALAQCAYSLSFEYLKQCKSITEVRRMIKDIEDSYNEENNCSNENETDTNA